MKSSEVKEILESKLENGGHQDVVMADESGTTPLNVNPSES
jgi:hypothetical protein